MRQARLPILVRRWKSLLALLAVLAVVDARLLRAQTGTFVDRQLPTDLRVVSYNIWLDSIFPDTHATRPAKFARVMQALRPDVVALQEIYEHQAEDVAALMDSILPLPGGAHWYSHIGGDSVIVSKFPLEMPRTNTQPAALQNMGIALVNLPDGQFATDLYLMNNHYKCCTGYDFSRQIQSDALVNWMRDARTPGEYVDLPAGTPMAVVGDLNIVDAPDPLTNLISGNVVNEATYGGDSPPDWDGSALADLHPLHNATGSADWTYRSSGFAPSRLDFVLYTDSAVDAANRFVLNTVAMTSAQRAATGLQQYDTTVTSSNYDHLPVVADFRFPVPGDYNGDRVVDNLDFQRWRNTFGSSSLLDADGNGNGMVDAGDYVVWRKWLNAGAGASAAAATAGVPEPASSFLALSVCGAAFFLQRNRWLVSVPGIGARRRPRRRPAAWGLFPL